MSVRPIRIGMYGNGHWAKLIRAKLATSGIEHVIVFDADSTHPHLDPTSLAGIDWAFVATPPETHFEIVDSCLRAGVHTFCEKPLSLSIHEVEGLYEIADSEGVCLYVDDVFVWREEFKHAGTSSVDGRVATWQKSDADPFGGLKLMQDLAYHHLYMFGTLFGFPEFDCVVTEFRNGLQFQLSLVNGSNYSFTYTKNAAWTQNEFLGIDFSHPSNDALLEMVRYVLQLTSTPVENRARVLWTTRVMRAVVSSSPERVAVVGGGIFGSTAALELAKNGYDVTVYEAESDLILGATLKNQLRIHRGYHYPRSDETAHQCLRSEQKFTAYFRPAIDDSVTHFYAIAREDSKVSPEEYEDFLDKHGLAYEAVENAQIGAVLNEQAVARIYSVTEASYSPERLRKHLKQRCDEEGVSFRFDYRVRDVSVLTRDYTRVVVATYSTPLLDVYGEIQFEICEKPVVRLPERFRGLSMVIMDGPFVSLDPYSGDKSLHLIGSVEDALHHTSVGKVAEIPENLRPYLDAGLVTNPTITNIDLFRERFAGLYSIEAEEIDHIGSYFMVRAVEAHRDADDRRISVLQEVDARVYNIFSAKVTSAPLISQQLLRHFMVESPLS